MNRLLLLVVLLALPAWAAEPVKAKITLKAKRTLDVEIVSRSADGWIYVHEAGSQAEVGIATADVEKMVFTFDVDGDKLDGLYSRGQFKAVCDLIGEPLRPALAYCDLPTNADAAIRSYLKALFWDARYQDVLDIVKTMAKSADPVVKQQAQLFRAMACVGLNRLVEADAELKKIGVLTAKDDGAPMYWYATAQLQIVRKDWLAAQETSARIVAFCGKNLEWLLPGLYLSAKCYANAKQDAVVAQITSEMNQMYPQSRWTTLMSQLAANSPTPDKGTTP